jgi:hypothetical protein
VPIRKAMSRRSPVIISAKTPPKPMKQTASTRPQIAVDHVQAGHHVLQMPPRRPDGDLFIPADARSLRFMTLAVRAAISH